MTARVFAPHLFTRWEPASGIYVPTMSTLPASRIGELIIINDKPEDAFPENLPRSQKRILDALDDYTDEDYIALMGDPILFAIGICVASDIDPGIIKALRWNREKRHYELFEINYYQLFETNWRN